MNLLDFDSPKNREKSLSDLTTLKDHPGWNLIVSIVSFNIDELRKQLEDGVGDGEDIQTVNRIRDKIKDHRNFINTPDMLIERLKPAEIVEEDSDDPYYKVI